MNMSLFWIIVAGFFFIAEIATVGFLLFWVGVGALLALIVTLFTGNILIQTTVFVISSIVLILATKPLVNKFTKKDKFIPTNIYSIIGKKGIVLEEINPVLETGTVKVAGEVWSALSKENSNLPVGSEIEIVSVEGVKVFVKLIRLPEKS
jgi:membrane protein implicated in regulation of membrane protease activity